MPLALSHWGFCSVCARAPFVSASACVRNVDYPAAHPRSPRSLPQNSRAPAASGESRLYAALSLLVHQLNYLPQRNTPHCPLLQKVPMARAAALACSFPDRIVSVPLYRADTGGGDLTKAGDLLASTVPCAGFRAWAPDHHAGTGDRNTTSSQRRYVSAI